MTCTDIRARDAFVSPVGPVGLALGVAVSVACSASGEGGATSHVAASDGTEQTTAAESLDSSSGTGGGPPPCQTDLDCDDLNLCNGTEVCNAASVCDSGQPPVDSTPCGEGMACFDGQCVATVCGNGEIEPGEDCDDANFEVLDGCDDRCRYEMIFRLFELTILPSPAASFCARPTSTLGDALAPFTLEARNAGTKADIDAGVFNSLIQFVNVTDFSGATQQTIELRMADAVLDPARGAWPQNSSNPVDWWFLMNPESMAPDGGFGIRVPEVVLSGGMLIGGPGSTLAAAPDLTDLAVHARISGVPEADTPAGPPDELADGLLIPQELIGDGPDEGVCGTLVVPSLAGNPIGPPLGDCLECPGMSHAYIECPGTEVPDTCNSLLDTLVGGCVLGTSCESGLPVIFPTQPDVNHGGVEVLTNDPENLNKIPSVQTDKNPNGYSVYFQFRARRAHVTGVN